MDGMPAKRARLGANMGIVGQANLVMGNMGSGVMTRSQLQQQLMGNGKSASDAEALSSAYFDAEEETSKMMGGSRGQRGGACRSTFQRKWLKFLVLSVLSGGVVYGGGVGMIMQGGITAAKMGTYVLSLLTGTGTCTVTPGALDLASTACIETAKFGAAIRTGMSTGVVTIPDAAKALIGTGAVVWGGGETLKRVIGTGGAAFEALIDNMCDLVFDDAGTFFIVAFWAGLFNANKAAAAAAAGPVVAAAAAGAEAGRRVDEAAGPAAPAAAGGQGGGYRRRHGRKSRKAKKHHRKSHKKNRKSRRN